ncbi:cell envelope integrity protein CreD [Jannaschia pagri]|uniref:Cell envelope integrity protein CreD n=1 Tax=Jannaschia pagri TaxID=2829797 RepID=A0ABQ4NL08_9RHOB|nr:MULTISPECIES: cell envelope integrity protein CreD [unclassified Jannaschia]GIT91273.1 cell envelope integrity protein CreD [Jannaschia sp. AI_61]GIT95106.1 cell envelope integrity protein CreD [Jannaschia sp. AI_62]
MRSAGVRFFIVFVLTLLMVIPLWMVGGIVRERSDYAESTQRTIGREWGGAQTVSGPVLVIPVEGIAYRLETREVVDRVTGDTTTETIETPYAVRRDPVILRPEDLDISVATASQIRSRGIFEVPVYTAETELAASFDTTRAATALEADETLQWDATVLRLGLSSNSGVRPGAEIKGPNGPLDLRPFGDGTSGGIEGDLGAVSGRVAVSARLTLNGSSSFRVTPDGRTTRVTMSGDWPDPGFTGAFLPETRTVTAEGFTATWAVPHLARAMPQVTRGDANRAFGFGTDFVQLGDFYQKAWRAARYGILFIALTFLCVLLTERRGQPTHPVQYVLIGLAQSLFVLLMVAYAEQVGFALAYGGAAAATIALLVMFGAIGLRLGRRTWVLGGLLMVLYAVLYLILTATDLALLAGATLAFLALAATMIVTRNEEWFGPKGPRDGFRRRTKD